MCEEIQLGMKNFQESKLPGSYWNQRCLACDGTGKRHKKKCTYCHGIGIWCTLCVGKDTIFFKRNCPNKKVKEMSEWKTKSMLQHMTKSMKARSK